MKTLLKLVLVSVYLLKNYRRKGFLFIAERKLVHWRKEDKLLLSYSLRNNTMLSFVKLLVRRRAVIC